MSGKRAFSTISLYVYEKVAIELLLKYREKIFDFSSIGRWWNRNEEIDFVAFNSAKNEILFGEVKWSKKPVGTDVYERLKEKSKKVVWGKEGKKEMFCLFSKSGYTNALLKTAKKEGLILFKGESLLMGL